MRNNQISNESSYIVSGEVIKILERESKYGNFYYDVHFKLVATGSFVRSCIYTRCRNYTNWTGLLEVGNILDNLQLFETKYHKLFVDADSFPVLIRRGNLEAIKKIQRIEKLSDPQQSLFDSRLSV